MTKDTPMNLSEDEFEGRELIEANLQRAVGEYEAAAFMFLIDKLVTRGQVEAALNQLDELPGNVADVREYLPKRRAELKASLKGDV